MWGAKLEGDARDLLAVEESDGGALAEAAAFLRATLASGAVAVSEIERAAKAGGYAWRTVVRANKSLKVIAKKDDGLHGKWRWRLPPAVEPAGAKPAEPAM